MKKTYEIELLGQKFNIKSTEAKEEVDRIIHFIKDRMKEIQKGSRTLTAHHAAILTLLNVADELFKSRKELSAFKDQVVKKSQRMIQLIDASFTSP